MKFAIQYNLMNEDQLQSVNNAVAQFPHVFVGVIPFSRELTSDEPLEGTDYIPYGSTLFTNLAKDLNWSGLHFDLSKFNYEASLDNRDDMLNANVDTVENHLDALSYCDFDDMMFIRPSEDLKQFSGQVMKAGDMVEWLRDAMMCESSGTYQLSPTTKILVDTVKNIQAEWRYFVVGGKIVSGSLYRAHGQMRKKCETNKDVLWEAQSFADKWLPDECCVMDLALVDNQVKVIEFNCINSSGFYDNDVDAIFKSLWDYHQHK